MMENLIFSGWEGVVRPLLAGVLAYFALLIQLRMSGKRTLSKMNAFDFIVTIALGSTLATVLLSKDVAVAEGAVAFATLIVLQFIITWLTVRYQWVNDLVKAQPVLLVYQGAYLHDAMKKARINQDEILSALRSSGVSSFEQVGAVVLETEGTLSVIKEIKNLDYKILENVKKPVNFQEKI